MTAQRSLTWIALVLGLAAGCGGDSPTQPVTPGTCATEIAAQYKAPGIARVTSGNGPHISWTEFDYYTEGRVVRFEWRDDAPGCTVTTSVYTVG